MLNLRLITIFIALFIAFSVPANEECNKYLVDQLGNASSTNVFAKIDEFKGQKTPLAPNASESLYNFFIQESAIVDQASQIYITDIKTSLGATGNQPEVIAHYQSQFKSDFESKLMEVFIDDTQSAAKTYDLIHDFYQTGDDYLLKKVNETRVQNGASPLVSLSSRPQYLAEYQKPVVEKVVEKKFPFKEGPSKKYKKLDGAKSIDEVDEIKVSSFNALDFSGEKTHFKVEAIKKAIKEESPDVLIMQEVNDLNFLEEFTRDLDSKYRAMYLEGNSSDNIVFIVRKDLPFNYELHSFKNAKNVAGKEIFGKDLPHLVLKDGSDAKMVISGVHFKSQRTSHSKNTTALKRAEQVEKALNVKNKIEKEYGDIAYIMGGDFNADLRLAKEYEQLNQQMSNSYSVANPEGGAQITNIAYAPVFDGSGQIIGHNRVNSQLDGILVNQFMSDKGAIKSSTTYLFENAKGEKLKMNDPRLERSELSSDHAFISTTLSYKKLME